MANLKITELAALTVVNNEDLIAIVDDPTGTASTKKIRTDDFQSTWHVGARVYNDAAIAIVTGTWTDLTFNSERYDTDTIHDTSTATNRLTCKTAGKYLIGGNVSWATGNNLRYLTIYYNNTSFIAALEFNASAGGVFQNINCVYDLAVNDYVTLRVNHTHGSNINIDASGNFSPEFWMHRIG